MKNPRPRDVVKDLHECASIQEVLDILNLDRNKQFKIIDRPDPPDAVIFDGESHSWIEHVDAYRSQEEAKELLSFITPGEVPYQRVEQVICSPDDRIAHSIICNLRKKLIKTSYKKYFEKYGKGILIINEQDFLFSESSMTHIKKKINKLNSLLKMHYVDQGYFEKVYIKFKLSYWTKSGLMAIYPAVEAPMIPSDVISKQMVEKKEKLESIFWKSANLRVDPLRNYFPTE